MKYTFLSLAVAVSMGATLVSAQTSTPTTTATSTAETVATTTAAELTSQREAVTTQANDTTQPERETAQQAIFAELEKRPLEGLTFYNFFAFWVQEAIFVGIPANTIFLILLTPIIALVISFTRVVIGLPTVDMLVPIALAFAFVSVGVGVGLFILGAVVLASYIAKMLVSNIRMMFYPKRSLSLLILSIFVFAALTVALFFEYEQVLSLSIFPILILILLGDSIVSVQLHKSLTETLTITLTTIGLGLMGYLLATSEMVRNTLIVYPELVLLVIPLNILIGRYFGLRLTEVFRFREFVKD
jgi:hypothetical protein